ncbi:unnamed protein product, partial [Mesorhabditis spiculigera]
MPKCGVLKKYTNFMNGYQDRYFEIRNGRIAYFYSKADRANCRGQFSMKNVLVEAHMDNSRDLILRFPGDIVWYLQAEDAVARDQWLKALTKEHVDSDYSSASTTTHTHSRNPSISSATELRLPLEKEAIVDSRLSDLQGYRDLIAARLGALEKAIEVGTNVGKVEALEVRATKLAVLSTIDDIVELLRRGGHTQIVDFPTPASPETTEETPMSASNESISTFTPAPPRRVKEHNTTSDGEEEFHDADEHSSLGSIEEGTEARERDSRPSSACQNRAEPPQAVVQVVAAPKRNLPFGCFDHVQLPGNYELHAEVEEITMQQLRYAMEGVDNSTWTLFAEDGQMKMFKREVEMDGLPVDPLKALHHVKGVSALEYMHYFFDPRYKKNWDHTLEAVSVLDNPSPDTALLHQRHKTIWPAASRESLFWTHIRRVDAMKSPDAADLYIVCNKDVIREDVPLGTSSSVRVKLTVSMVCETLIAGNKPAADCTRADVSCRILYVSCVHPGGWVPTAALRTVYKKEYPKFLRTFTEFVLSNVKDKPLAM